MNLVHLVRKFCWRLGLDIQRFDPNLNFDRVHQRMLQRYDIDLVLDVGANIGQFGKQLRRNYEYPGDLISFEPMSAARLELGKAAEGDPRWKVAGHGLGDVSGSSVLNISANSQSSSILPMHESHESAAPDSRYVSQEIIEIKKLDDIYGEIGAKGKNVFLKMDVQGYELKVLAGGAESLSRIPMVRMEMSVRPLYQSEHLIEELIVHMREKGFQLVGIEPNFSDPATGALLQVDGLFCRL